MVRTEDYTRELATIFFSQKNIILFSTFTFTLLALLVAFFWPPTYAAQGTILVKGNKRIKSPEALETSQSQSSLISSVSKEDLASEMNIIISYDVLEKTVTRLHDLDLLPGDTDLAEGPTLQKLVDGLQKGLKIKLIPASNIIMVQYPHRDPRYSVTVLKLVFDEYLRYRSTIYNPTGVEPFYRQQTIKFSKGIEELERRLIALSERAGTPRPGLEIENNLITKRESEHRLLQLRQQWIEKKLQVESLEKSLGSDELQLFSYLPVTSINTLAEKVQALVVEKANLLSLYTPESKKMKNTERQITSSFNALKEEVAAYAGDQKTGLKVLESQIGMLEEKLRIIASSNLSLNSHQVESSSINRELDLQKQSYDIFMKRWEEAKINSSSDANSLFSTNILSKPTVSDRPIFPKKKLIVPFGILAGFITGCCFGFIREFFDHSFKKPEDVSKYANLPTIMSIPQWETKVN